MAQLHFTLDYDFFVGLFSESKDDLNFLFKFHRPLMRWNLLPHSRYLLFHIKVIGLSFLLTAVGGIRL